MAEREGALLFEVVVPRCARLLPRKPSGFRDLSSASENSRFHPFLVQIILPFHHKNTDPNMGQYFYGGERGICTLAPVLADLGD